MKNGELKDSELIVLPYDANWPDEFQKEKSKLLSIFDVGSVVIEHIGSTSVPKLGAKPIIDIMLGVEDLKLIEKRVGEFQVNGYEYVPKHESKFPQRRYLRKSTVHLHCVLLVSSFWKDRLLFRDYLRQNRSVADQYHNLKLGLAAMHKRNHRAYSEGKSDFIADVLRKARNDNGAV